MRKQYLSSEDFINHLGSTCEDLDKLSDTKIKKMYKDNMKTWQFMQELPFAFSKDEIQAMSGHLNKVINHMTVWGIQR
tara:strand:- start:476 stop:709 length:234 start_codon:yes stop_codon:yes gene_type:complete